MIYTWHGHARIVIRYLFAALSLVTGAACTLVGGEYRPATLPAPAVWHAPLQAHGGDPVSLAQWWTRFDDPALVALIGAAQRESATVALAAARISQARAAALTADLADSPAMEGVASANRAAFSFGGPAQRRTLIQVGPQASWEIDLFGGIQRGREAAAAAWQSSQAAWHDARVSVAAEVAHDYLALRYCEALLALAREELQTHRETVRIMERALQVGLLSGAAVLSAKAVAAQAADIEQQRRAQCESAIKVLVALTGMEEPALRELAAPARGALPRPVHFVVDAVPARAIAQRPDIAAAERDLAAASARIGVAQAARYPSLSLTGNILPSLASLNGSALASVVTWALGPALTLPLADGGRRAANIEAARVQFTALDTVLRAKVRQAVREVEEALVRLDAARGRERESQAAHEALSSALQSTRARVKTGLGSQLDLLEAQRNTLAVHAGVIQARHEQAVAWVALYRAVGGGWDGDLAVPVNAGGGSNSSVSSAGITQQAPNANNATRVQSP